MSGPANNSEHLLELLKIHRRNLQHLDEQIASYGGRMSSPILILNQRDEADAAIQRLESQLAAAPPSKDAIAADALLARLEGLLGQKAAETIQNALNQAQPAAGKQIGISGDGNIVGSNNTIVVIEDATLRERLRKNKPIISPPETTLPPVRVFISSTMKDQQPERDAVARAIESIDLEAVRAEMIGSQSASPLEASRMMAQNCDIYLGIYGGRHGTAVPGDGRSVTAIEYDEARQANKPILIYRRTDVEVEPKQDQFLKRSCDLIGGHLSRKFKADDVPDNLIGWVQEDVKAEVARHPEWKKRPPLRARVLLASLGLSPGAVTGMYHALARAGKPVTRIVTFSPANRDVRDAAGICESEFRRLGVPYRNHYLDAEDIASDNDAQAFKGTFNGLLQELVSNDAEVLVGITGGRTIMGALMAIVAQTAVSDQSAARVSLYHLDVDDDIEEEGRLPRLWNYQHDEHRWRELLAPPAAKCRLVPVPYVRIT